MVGPRRTAAAAALQLLLVLPAALARHSFGTGADDDQLPAAAPAKEPAIRADAPDLVEHKATVPAAGAAQRRDDVPDFQMSLSGTATINHGGETSKIIKFFVPIIKNNTEISDKRVAN